MEQFIVSARKYRPQTFASVIGQSSITGTLKNAIVRKHLAHAYLFCGPRGVGKTTCARIFAKTINCLNPTPEMEACDQCESCLSFKENRSYSIHELDAASNNSVEDIRQLIEQVRVPPQIGQYSLYIIDEVHMLSTAAFNAFLKTLEEPPAHAIFILATTEKHKILPTILSRCQIFDFNRIRVDDTVEFLKYIAGREGVTGEDRAFHVIAQKADGAMRDALSIFDQVVSFCGNDLHYTQVIENLNVLDYDYYFKITDAFLAQDYVQALLIFNTILSKGFEAQHFIAGLASHMRDLLVCKDPQTVVLLEVSDDIRQQYVQQAQRCDDMFLFEALNLANKCDVGYKASGNPRLHIELCLLQIAYLGVEKKKDEPSVAPTMAPLPLPTATTAEVPQRGAAPAVEPVATPAPSPSPAPTISIKGALKGTAMPQPTVAPVQAQPPTVAPAVPDTEAPLQVLSKDSLLSAWSRYILRIEASKTRLANAMGQIEPMLVDGNTIVCEVTSSLYVEALKAEERELLGFMQQCFHHPDLHLDVRLETEDGIKRKPMTAPEKLRYFADKNPAFDKLKQAIGLDFD